MGDDHFEEFTYYPPNRIEFNSTSHREYTLMELYGEQPPIYQNIPNIDDPFIMFRPNSFSKKKDRFGGYVHNPYCRNILGRDLTVEELIAFDKDLQERARFSHENPSRNTLQRVLVASDIMTQVASQVLTESGSELTMKALFFPRKPIAVPAGQLYEPARLIYPFSDDDASQVYVQIPVLLPGDSEPHGMWIGPRHVEFSMVDHIKDRSGVHASGHYYWWEDDMAKLIRKKAKELGYFPGISFDDSEGKQYYAITTVNTPFTWNIYGDET
jgi:hypothetical protein